MIRSALPLLARCLLLPCCLAVTGCDGPTRLVAPQRSYRCTAEQVKLAGQYFTECNRSAHISDYCWNAAVESSCSYIIDCRGIGGAGAEASP